MKQTIRIQSLSYICMVLILTVISSLLTPLTAFAEDNNQKDIKNISHRGYCTIAPENTLPAYQLAKQNGFSYVETDVSFTKDNVPVLLHDSTINRTARNAYGSELSSVINIGDITYNEALNYDFGIWKNVSYKGTTIPTFEQFINLCSQNSFHPYIELKANGQYTSTQIGSLVDLVRRYNMLRDVTWISFNDTYLSWIKDKDPQARLGYLASTVSGQEQAIITKAVSLQNNVNDVFLDLNKDNLTANMISLCKDNGFALEVWTINSTDEIKALDPYISGITTNGPKYEDAFTSPEPVPDVTPDIDISPFSSESGLYSGIKVSQPKGKIKIRWEKDPYIKKYEVYVSYMNDKFSDKPTKTTTGSHVIIKKIAGEKIDAKKNFKIYLAAFDREGKIVGKSFTAYIAGKKNKKYSNPKSITITQKSINLDVGESRKIKATVKLEKAGAKRIPNSKVPKLRFKSTNPAVASVNKKGKIIARGKGSCFVYVFTANGLSKKISVNVTD